MGKWGGTHKQDTVFDCSIDLELEYIDIALLSKSMSAVECLILREKIY